jgi:hypothetical protein
MSDEVCERTRTLDGTVLRRKCARFVQDHASAIAKATPEVPVSLNDRAADIWEPLLVLADLAGKLTEGSEGSKGTRDWPRVAREAAEKLSAKSQESNPIASLLLDILLILVQIEGERIFSRTLVAGLNARRDRPWAQMRNGKEITELWLAQQLRPYGIRSKTLWIGEEAAKGYEKDDFGDIFARYVPRSEAQEFVEELARWTRPKEENRKEGAG